MLSLLLPLLCPPTCHCPPTPPQLVAPEQEQEESKAKPKVKTKKKFARLTSPMKKTVQAGMHLIRKGEKEEDVAKGTAQIIEVGEAAVPACMDAVKRLEEAGRLDALWQSLDAILVDEDLPLAWKLMKKKAPDTLRIYLVRRRAESELKETKEFLTPLMAHENPDIAYEAARGLAFRGVAATVPAIEAQVVKHWLKEADRLRADFANVERGALAQEVLPLLQRKRNKDKLAGIRMFELFGLKEQIRLLHPFLSESDTTLRLAAINACRVIVSGEEPLDRPSMTEIIERAEAWKAKL